MFARIFVIFPAILFVSILAANERVQLRKKITRESRRGPNAESAQTQQGQFERIHSGQRSNQDKSSRAVEEAEEEDSDTEGLHQFGEHIKCGKHWVSRMAVFKYTSALDQKGRQIRLAKNWIAQGGFGKVHVGFFEWEQQKDVLMAKCVAVKISRPREQISEEFTQTKEVVQAIRKLRPHQRTHLIETFDIGLTQANEELVIMELGGKTLEDHLYTELNKEHLEEAKLIEMVQEAAVPLRQFHQVAMHLDVKPSNLMYVREEKSTKPVLKLIDFDGAELIPREEPDEADWCTAPKIPIQTPLYVYPEYYLTDCKGISIKSDVYSLGIMAYEFTLLQKHLWPQGAINMSFLRDAVLDAVGSVHRGFTVQMQNGANLLSNLAYTPSERQAIKHVLQVWTSFPQIAALVSNLLHTDSSIRMSANGVLDFLAGNCYPRELKTNTNRIRIFNKITVSELQKWIRQNQTSLREEIVKKVPLYDFEVRKNEISAEATGPPIKYNFGAFYASQLADYRRDLAVWDELDAMLKRAVSERVSRYMDKEEQKKKDCDTVRSKL